MGFPVTLEAEAKRFGNGAHITVPKAWIGRKVVLRVVRDSGKAENLVPAS